LLQTRNVKTFDCWNWTGWRLQTVVHLWLSWWRKVSWWTVYIFYCNSDCYRLGVWELWLLELETLDCRTCLVILMKRSELMNCIYVFCFNSDCYRLEVWNLCLLVLENVVQLWLSQQIRVSRWTLYVTGSGKTGVSAMLADLIFDHEHKGN